MGHPEEELSSQTHSDQQQYDTRQPPPPPEPSHDAGIVPPIKSPHLQGLDHLTTENIDIFTLDAVAALKLLCRGAQFLVDVTGDVPPTPAINNHASSFPASSETVQNLNDRPSNASLQVPGSTNVERDHIDGVPFTRTPIGSPEAHLHEPIVHGSASQPAAVQYAALVRKFYSKRPPPISLEDYLFRMHKFCPMSTAVYLATSCYITFLAMKEKICPVTPRNVHRLLLAGLRVAMKALEDLKWPHSRVAKVGGVSEAELCRLEIGFCFLMDFGLKVDEQMLLEEAQNLLRLQIDQRANIASASIAMELKLPEPKHRRTGNRDGGNHARPDDSPRSQTEKRKASSSLPQRPVQHLPHGMTVVGST